MAKELTLGFGIHITASPKDLILLENCYRDWWIACEDDTNGKTTLYLVECIKNPDGSYTLVS
jgi:hypothetical protein